MIYGDIHNKENWDYLTRIKDLSICFNWLLAINSNINNGNYDIGRKLSAYVHSYDTIDVEKAKFESHLKSVDLQFCINGGERIDWAPISSLQDPSEYNEDNDVIHYKNESEQITSLNMIPGRFVIFGQSDGHKPKINDSINSSVHKLVIKISAKVLYNLS